MTSGATSSHLFSTSRGGHSPAALGVSPEAAENAPVSLRAELCSPGLSWVGPAPQHCCPRGLAALWPELCRCLECSAHQWLTALVTGSPSALALLGSKEPLLNVVVGRNDPKKAQPGVAETSPSPRVPQGAAAGWEQGRPWISPSVQPQSCRLRCGGSSFGFVCHVFDCILFIF